MSKYINADLFREEIDKIEEEARKVRVSGTDKEAIGAEGKVSLCLKLKSLIDSLQQEQPCEGLEEAAKEIATDILGKDYLSELDEDCAIDALNEATNLVKAGAEWQKEQMLQLAKNRYEVVMAFGTGNPDVDQALQMDRLALVKIIEEGEV